MSTEKETHSPAGSRGDWKQEKDWEGLQLNDGSQVPTQQQQQQQQQQLPPLPPPPDFNYVPQIPTSVARTAQFEHEGPYHQGQQGLQATPIQPPQNNGKWKRLEDDDERDGRTVLGLRAPVFWMLVVIFVLVISGAIGGGVAAAISAQSRNKNNSSQFASSSFSAPTPAAEVQPTSSTTRPTSTLVAPPSGASPSLTSPCDSSSRTNGSIITAADISGQPGALNGVAHVFTLLCNTNYPAGQQFGNPNTTDLMSLYPSPPTMQGCLNACVQYNLGAAVIGGSPKCKAVAIVKAPGGWCYFKSNTGLNDTRSSLGVPVDSAVLIERNA